MQAMTLNEAAQDFFSVIGRVNNDHEPLVVTDEYYKPVVIMRLDDFNAWQETAYRSSALAKDLSEAVADIHTRPVRRKPNAEIAGKGRILGDIMTPVVDAEDWGALA
jgi:antitoxin YefM